MNLIATKGLRTVYTHAEVAAQLGMTKRQVIGLAARGHIKKRFSGMYCFDQSDVNAFIHRLNNGLAVIGGGRCENFSKAVRAGTQATLKPTHFSLASPV